MAALIPTISGLAFIEQDTNSTANTKRRPDNGFPCLTPHLKDYYHELRMRELSLSSLKKSGRPFQISLAKFKMASTSGGGRAGRRENSGRKKLFKSVSEKKREWERSRKRISLENNIFKSWIQAKHQAGYDSSSDSDFAAHLLSLEYRRRQVDFIFFLVFHLFHLLSTTGFCTNDLYFFCLQGVAR